MAPPDGAPPEAMHGAGGGNQDIAEVLARLVERCPQRASRVLKQVRCWEVSCYTTYCSSV